MQSALKEAIRQLKENDSTLTYLDLFCNFIGHEGAKALAEALKENSILTTLDLWSNSIGDEGAKALAAALRENSILTRLNLESNSIGDEGAKELAEAFKNNSVLTWLDLQSNSIGAEGAKALAEALKENSILTALLLHYNSIDDEGAKALADALKENSVLTTLNLGGNSIGDDGAKALAEVVKKNSILMTLYLKDNPIHTEGAKALAEVLKKNSVLTTLNLGSNSIHDQGAKALAEALKENSVLTTLTLHSNSIHNEGAKALAEALKESSILTTLHLGGNSISDEGAKAFLDIDEGAKAFLDILENNVSLKDLTLSANLVSNYLMDKIKDMIKRNQDGSRAKMDHLRQTKFKVVKLPHDIKLDPDSKLMAKTNPPIATMQDPGSRLTVMIDSPIATSCNYLKDVMLNPDSEPTVISPEYIVECTNNFAKDHFLGGGAFGTMYEGVDVITRDHFTVQQVPLIITDQETLDKIQLSFKREITALKRFCHPNIIALYVYSLSTTSSKQFLVYELAACGSVTSFLMDDEGRAHLSSSIRLSILFQVTRALHFLHTGGCGGFIVFHHDMKSANICLMQDYTAKLINVGLAKFVTIDESQRTGSVTPSILKSLGAAAFGTPGYICKWYAGGNHVFQAKCDVYSLVVVMMELITGCLQGGQLHRHDVSFGDFYDCYVEDENEDEIKDGWQVLMKDADPMLEWDPQSLETICKSSVQCLSR